MDFAPQVKIHVIFSSVVDVPAEKNVNVFFNVSSKMQVAE